MKINWYRITDAFLGLLASEDEGISSLHLRFFFFLRRYNFREVSTFSTNSFHLGRFLMQSFQSLIFNLLYHFLHHPPAYFRSS